MAKKISREELGIDGNLFADLIKDLEQAKLKTKGLEVESDALKSIYGQLTKEAQAYAKALKEINLSTTEGQKQYQQTSKEATQTLVNEEKVKQSQLRTAKLIQQSKQAELRTEKMLNNERGKTLTAYQKESKALNDNRNAYKNLAVQNKENTREGRALLKVIKEQDSNLKRIDATVGQNQRSVGNYTKAIGGLKSGLAQLGLAFGAFQLIKGATATVVEFDSAIADLSSITGATGKDLDFFKQQAIKMGVDVKGGASSVVEAYKLIASAKPELLENADALNSVTEAAILLSRASGMELPAAATALTDAMNQFGASSDEAGKFVDVLAAGAKFGAAEIPQITEALLKFGAVAKTSNVSVQESTALIEALAEKGLKGADAGTALRNVMLKLSAPDALPKDAQGRLKALGVDFDKLKDKSLPFAERLELLKPLLKDNAALVKTFGSENAVAATTLISSTERIQDLTNSVDKNGIATEQASVRSKTIAEAFNRVKETLNGLILGFANGVNSSKVFVSVLDFLARNLGTIVSVVGKATVAFIAFKVAMKAIEFSKFISEEGGLKAVVKGMFNLSSSTDKATESNTKLKASLKAIGWTAVIALAMQFAKQIWNIVDGTSQLNETLAKLEKGGLRGAEQGTKKIIEIQKMFDKSSKDYTKNVNAQIKVERDAERERLARVSKGLEALRVIEKAGAQSSGALFTKIMNDNLQFMQEYGITIDNVADKIGDLRGAYKNSEARILKYNEALGESNVSTDVSTKAIESNTKAKKEKNKETDLELTLLKERKKAGDPELASADRNSELIERQRVLNVAEYFRIQKEIELSKYRERGDSESVLRVEEELLDLKRDQIEAQKQVDLFGASTPEEALKIAKQAELDIQNLNGEALAEEQKHFEDVGKYIDLLADKRQEALDKQIALLDKEISAQQKQQERLRELADNGNIQASESLAEADRLEREAQAEKQKLEQRKKYIEISSIFLKTYANALNEGKSGGEALAIATGDVGILEGALSLFPSFFEGTEDTGKVVNGLDSNGGRLALLHDNERVLTKEQNKSLDGLSNADVVAMVQKAKVADSMGDYSNSGWENIAVINELNGLSSKMDGVIKAIQDKPEIGYNLEEVATGVVNLVKTVKNGNMTTYNRFRIEK